jgi:hypothetical protein
MSNSDRGVVVSYSDREMVEGWWCLILTRGVVVSDSDRGWWCLTVNREMVVSDYDRGVVVSDTDRGWWCLTLTEGK